VHPQQDLFGQVELGEDLVTYQIHRWGDSPSSFVSPRSKGRAHILEAIGVLPLALQTYPGWLDKSPPTSDDRSLTTAAVLLVNTILCHPHPLSTHLGLRLSLPCTLYQSFGLQYLFPTSCSFLDTVDIYNYIYMCICCTPPQGSHGPRGLGFTQLGVKVTNKSGEMTLFCCDRV